MNELNVEEHFSKMTLNSDNNVYENASLDLFILL